jgi:hypothetical protein
MKRIISLLCVACLVLITACSDDKEVGPIFDSVLTPDFTFDDGAEIIACSCSMTVCGAGYGEQSKGR